MIRAVLDANVFASGVLRYQVPAKTTGATLRAWGTRALELVTCDKLITEIERTLSQPYFATRISNDLRHTLMTALRDDATRTSLSVIVSGVASHPEDDLVLSVAVSATVDVLVTGDRQLQKLTSFQGIAITSPRVFLGSHGEHSKPGSR
ncbi:MAG: putative toxin-antitoxin system toxin component, PIN family [Thermomicrobiales bacterium]